MKKVLSIALVATLSFVFFLPVVFAQGEGSKVVPKLEQQLAKLESVFNELEHFMSELVIEVKGNMADINYIDKKLEDLRNVVKAVAAELKEAEGKIVGLGNEINIMAGIQQEHKVRIVALQDGVAKLSAWCDELRATLEGVQCDLAAFIQAFDALAKDYQAVKSDFYGFKESVLADISALKKCCENLSGRVEALEKEDVGSFKKRVLELERSMSALAIKIDNNRAKLEGFDQAIAGLAGEVEANKNSILTHMNLLEDHEARLTALEGNTKIAELQEQVNTLYFLAILGLLAGIGALVWGFLGS